MTLADMKPTPPPANRIQRPLTDDNAATVLRTPEYGWPEETVVEARECAVARARASYEARVMDRAHVRQSRQKTTDWVVVGLAVAVVASIGLLMASQGQAFWVGRIATALAAQAGGW